MRPFDPGAFCAHMQRVLQGPGPLEDQVQALIERLEQYGQGDDGLAARALALQTAYNSKLARLRDVQQRLLADKAGVDIAQSTEMATLLQEKQRCEHVRALLRLKQRLYENYEALGAQPPAIEALGEEQRYQLFSDFQAIHAHGLLRYGVARIDALHSAYMGMILRYFTHNQVNAEVLQILTQTPDICAAYLASVGAASLDEFAAVARKAVLFCRSDAGAGRAIVEYVRDFLGRQRLDYQGLLQANRTLAQLGEALNSAELTEVVYSFNVATLARTKFAGLASVQALRETMPLQAPGEAELLVYAVLRLVSADEQVCAELNKAYFDGLAQTLRDQAGLTRLIRADGQRVSIQAYLDAHYAPGPGLALNIAVSGLQAVIELQNAIQLRDGATQQLLDNVLNAVVLSQLLRDVKALRREVATPVQDQQTEQLPRLVASLS